MLALRIDEVRTKDLTDIGVPRCYLARMVRGGPAQEGRLWAISYSEASMHGTSGRRGSKAVAAAMLTSATLNLNRARDEGRSVEF